MFQTYPTTEQTRDKDSLMSSFFFVCCCWWWDVSLMTWLCVGARVKKKLPPPFLFVVGALWLPVACHWARFDQRPQSLFFYFRWCRSILSRSALPWPNVNTRRAFVFIYIFFFSCCPAQRGIEMGAGGVVSRIGRWKIQTTYLVFSRNVQCSSFPKSSKRRERARARQVWSNKTPLSFPIPSRQRPPLMTCISRERSTRRRQSPYRADAWRREIISLRPVFWNVIAIREDPPWWDSTAQSIRGTRPISGWIRGDWLAS